MQKIVKITLRDMKDIDSIKKSTLGGEMVPDCDCGRGTSGPVGQLRQLDFGKGKNIH